jgi:CRP-like cAMP-binding protein
VEAGFIREIERSAEGAPRANGERKPRIVSRLPLLEVEPGLGAQLCPEELRDARSRCLVSVVGLPRGKRVTAPDGGFLVVRGILTRRLHVGDRSGSELLGRGDVIYPTPGPTESAWRVEQTALLAVLDERFHRCAAAWPRVVMALHERAVLRSHSLLLRLAIVEHPQIRRRVHLVLWHLADRWGSTEEHGAFLPLKLSRVALADLVCSTRESVSRALAELGRLGLVHERGSGFFLRFPRPAELEETPDA